MGYKISDIEGVGGTYAEKLEALGINSVEDMLKKGGNPRGRKSLAADSGISEKLILRWTNHADLMRIKGVGPQYAELLEAAGVDTVKELRNRNAGNLVVAMTETNTQKNLANVNPSQAVVEAWVAQAKALNPAVSY
jgi:predicted flap endonuclease-1-like 5' DNA nuclease